MSVSTINRDKIYKDLINNKQTVLISLKMDSQRNYIGVSKHRGIYFSSEKREPMGQIEALANM